MKYIDYIRWRIQLQKHKNVILFPIEKIVNSQARRKTLTFNREKGDEILTNKFKE